MSNERPKQVLRNASLQAGDTFPADRERVLIVQRGQGGFIEVWWLEDER